MGSLKVFISYSTHQSHEKRFAGDLKRAFEDYVGFSVYLAHDDIDPSDDFDDEILLNLAHADIVIPIISANLSSSIYANQEIGIAFAKNKKIIPLSYDGSNPKGFRFISGKQAIKSKEWNDDSILAAITKIYALAIEHPKFLPYKEKAKDSLCYALKNSNHFKTTSIIIQMIKMTHSVERFNDEQIAYISDSVATNREIYLADYLFPKIKQFLHDEYAIEVDRPNES